MPSEPPRQVQVEFTPEFKRNVRALAKKYRHIRSDIQPVIERLEAGEIFGIRFGASDTPFSKCGSGIGIFGKANGQVIV